MTVTETPITTRAQQVKQASLTRLPAQVNAAFDAEIDRLVAVGVPAGVAQPGSPMPDGELLEPTGQSTSLSATRGGRAAVVVFYRGAWCPYCNVTLRVYQDQLVPELQTRGVVLIAVSPQKPGGSLTMTQKNELSYPVLSDPGLVLAEQLGIVFTLSQEALAAQAGLGLDLTAVNADGMARLPLATTVVVDQAGMISWIDVHPDYTTRSEPAQILGALDQLEERGQGEHR